MGAKYNLIGQRFGRLVVIEKLDPDKFRRAIWKCLCDCGGITNTRTDSLRSGHTQSCGCKFEIKKCGKNHKLYGGFEEISGQVFCDIKKQARSRNLEFDITIEYLWDLFIQQNRKCALSGMDIRFGEKTGDGLKTASLDRIDNTKGYVKGNVQWLHKWINIMKSDHTTNEFIEFCKMVSNHNI